MNSFGFGEIFGSGVTERGNVSKRTFYERSEDGRKEEVGL